MYLITSEYLFENTRIKKGTTWDVLQPYFKDVQDIYVKDLLGIPLLELYTDHVEIGTTLTPEQSTLFNTVQKYFAKRVEYDYALFGNVNLNNSGVRTDTAGDIALINKVRSELAIQFTQYEERITQYLAKNTAAFQTTYYANDADDSTRNTSALGFSFKPLKKRYYY